MKITFTKPVSSNSLFTLDFTLLVHSVFVLSDLKLNTSPFIYFKTILETALSYAFLNPKPGPMLNNRHLILYPFVLQQTDVLTISSVSGFFSDSEYVITNDEGRIFRKGKIINKIIELKLRLVGLKTGFYIFKMGEFQERFEVI